MLGKAPAPSRQEDAVYIKKLLLSFPLPLFPLLPWQSEDGPGVSLPQGIWCSEAITQRKASASAAGMAAPCWWGICGRAEDHLHHWATKTTESSSRSVPWKTELIWKRDPAGYWTASYLLSSPPLGQQDNPPPGMGRGRFFLPVQVRHDLLLFLLYSSLISNSCTANLSGGSGVTWQPPTSLQHLEKALSEYCIGMVLKHLPHTSSLSWTSRKCSFKDSISCTA